MDEPYQQLNSEDFLIHYNEDRITPPSKANYDELPYNDLSPRRFEQLCLKYTHSKYGVSNCTLYGNPGQEQYGLDILVYTGQSQYTLYQCKRVQEFSAANLIAAIKKFTDGKWFDQTKEFILFSSDPLIEKNFVNEFETQRVKLEASDINLVKMGAGEINAVLREHPAIVDEFFGENWVKEFTKAPFRDIYLKNLKPLPEKKIYPEVDNYIARKLLNTQKAKIYYSTTTYDRQTIQEWLTEQNALGLPIKTVIRSDAGLGKSKELEHLAYVYSQPGKKLFPIIIRLKNYENNLIKLINAFYEDWQAIPPELLLFLFDGLDEVPNTAQKAFNKEFNLHLQTYAKANIVATARSNHSLGYIGEGIDPNCILKEQFLQPLSIWDIHDYIKNRLINPGKIVEFNKIVKEKKLDDLLNNPFYLKNLCEIFDSEKIVFPIDRADAIRKIIDLKLAQDRKKYELDFSDEHIYLFFAKKLAIYLTLTGTNSIPFPEIIKFSQIGLDAIRYCSLFGLEETESYYNVYFEHNNFQEYLAAKYLSELTWDKLSTILFHEPKYDILKPRLINTANYLFTVLDRSTMRYQKFFNKLHDNNNELLLTFERDKIPYLNRLEIFKAIIFKGKSEEIYYLRSSYRVTDLLDFINHSAQGIEFIIEEINQLSIQAAHLQCLLEIMLFFKPSNLTGELRRVVHRILKRLIVEDHQGSIHDLVIDIMAAHNFSSEADINFIIKKCKNLENQMVIGALFKMIRKAQSEPHFKFVVENVHHLIDHQKTVVAGLEYEFLFLSLELLNASNIRLWSTFMADEVNMLSDMLDNIFDPDKGSVINDIYIKMAELYTIMNDGHIYTEFLRFVDGIQFYNSERHWGNPALFFIHSDTREIAFKQLIKDGDNLMYRLTVAGELANESLLKQVHEESKTGNVTLDRINNIRFALLHRKKNELEDYFTELFALDERNKNPKPPFNWNQVYLDWQTMDFELLRNKNLFLEEAKNLYTIISQIDGFDEDGDWFRLQYNEKAVIKKQITNSLIFRTIERGKITGGFESFQNWLESADWEWFVFFNIKTLLVDKKIAVPADLMQQFQYYTVHTFLPKVNFRNPFIKLADGRIASVQYALTIKNLFVQGHIDLSQSVLLDLLSFDISGYYKISPGDMPNDKLYVLLHNKINEDSHFRQRILANLQRDFPAEAVLNTHCSICVSYYYTEAIPFLFNFLENRKLEDATKRAIVKTILSLGADPAIFTETTRTLSYVKTEWQWDIFYALFNKFENTEEDTGLDLVSIADKSIKKLNVDHRLKWDMIKVALKLGSTIATKELFAFLNRKPTWHNFSLIDAKDFFKNNANTPKIIIDRCIVAVQNAINQNEEQITDLEKFLKKVILQIAVTDYSLVLYALQKYEDLILENREKNPFIVYLRWDKKEMIKEYYLQSSKFENENQVVDLINQISA